MRANAEREGRARDYDAALDAFCDEWNCGSLDEARFDKEYLVAVGTKRQPSFQENRRRQNRRCGPGAGR